MSKTNDNCWEAKSQHIEKMFWETAVLLLIFYIRIKGEDIKFIGDRLGRWEQTESGNFWDWINSETNRHTSPQISVHEHVIFF